MPLRVVTTDGATKSIGVAVDVFGGAGDREGGPQLKRPLHQGRGKGVVHHHWNASVARCCADRLEVNHLEQGIGGAFEPNHGGLARGDGG